MGIHRFSAAVLCAGSIVAVSGHALAGLPAGPDTQLAYLASGPQIMLIDTVTGDRDILSGSGNGSGTAFGGNVADVAIEDANTLLACANPGFGPPELFRVDRATGDRTLLSITDSGSPASIGLTKLLEIERESPTTLLYLGWDNGSQSYVGRIDLGTMTRSIVSSVFPSVGSGASIGNFGLDMVTEPGGTLMVMDFGNGRMVRVDPATGVRSTPRPGFLLYSPSIVQLPSGTFLLTEYATERSLYTYNAATDSLVDLGADLPSMAVPCAADCYDDSTVVMYNGGGTNGSILRINSTTGAQTTVAGTGVGTGPNIPTGSYFDPTSLVLLDSASSADVSDWSNY